MIVLFQGPRGGAIDDGLNCYAQIAVQNFAKQLKINRLKLMLEVNFHHQIHVDKATYSEGLCEAKSKRHFVIDVALYSNWVSTLAHELVHVKQFARGELNEQLTHWKGRDHSDTEYWDQPWEKEARKLQHKLVMEFDNF
jgi:hypothetical protein